MIFTQQLQRIDTANPQDAIKKMANHIKYIQEQLEYTLLNLDSRNINEIDVNKTTITDSSGSTNIGSFIYLTGTNGESFTVGKNPKGQFEFAVEGKGGKQTMYLNSSGELIITEHTNLTIDGGEW
jgi:hypothetical protein